MLAGWITHGRIVQVLVGGFTLVILLLLTSGFVGVRNIQSIQQNAASLVREQRVTNRLMDEIQRQQTSLSEVFSVLARDPDSLDSGKILAQLDETDRNIARVAEEGAQTPQHDLWSQLNSASSAFSAEARRLLEEENPESFASRELFRLHGEVLGVITRLMEASYKKVVAAQSQIDRRSTQLMKESVLFLAACLLLALVFTAVTVRMATQLVRSMEWQAGELSRVSWQMLENQESTARRFSHELHDELGQSLTAVKTNLAALGRGFDTQRLDDCMRLVDEALGNVRQMSQLLHPTILDDFGLDAGLRWLCEGFGNRTGIEAGFKSNLSGRLPDETETHLFRIAQEALTNVARHSGASAVEIDLHAGAGQVTLRIRDNGRGLGAAPQRPGALGIVGMRARAHSAGGDVWVRSEDGRGVTIEVKVPASSVAHEREDSYPAG